MVPKMEILVIQKKEEFLFKILQEATEAALQQAPCIGSYHE